MSKGWHRKPLRYRELLRRLRKYGVVEVAKRGKGSERILLRPEAPGSKRGAIYPIKHHGAHTEITIPVIEAALRCFGIEAADFWHG